MGTHVKRSQAKLMQLKNTKKDLSKRQSLIRKEMNRVGSMHDNEFDEKEIALVQYLIKEAEKVELKITKTQQDIELLENEMND